MGLRRRLAPLLPLLGALLVCIRSQDQKSAFAIVGEDFTFSPKVNKTITEITWKKGKNKVAELEGGRLPEYFPPLDKGRGVLDGSSGNLTIRNVNVNDAAEYEAQVLAAGSNQLQITKFVLEVLDPPSLELNCSVTNDQISISCESHFSKKVTYSWNHAGKGEVIKADGSVVQFEKNADLPEQVVCTIEVSKTKISSSISLSACPQESSESLTRGRAGIIAFVVIVFLLLIMIALLCTAWKKGWFNNIHNWIPTNQSAAYKIEEPPEDEAVQRKNGQKEDEGTNMEEKQPLVAESPHSSHQRHNDEESHKEDENTKSGPVETTKTVVAQSHQSSNQSQADEESRKGDENTKSGPEPEYENVRVSEDAANRSDEGTNKEEKQPLVAQSPPSGDQSEDAEESRKGDENTKSGPDEATKVEERNPLVAQSPHSGNQSQADEV
ncbi:lymphocyte function-associated antigen 3 isoform X2 [Emydura macquarii macquarii]|uniref:lymphocyte function-associated antigen 3 isoform X2 n=1 Tax=Emydura macquarii macquarii TaxID=1129001 RepID=UPI00352ABDE4